MDEIFVPFGIIVLVVLICLPTVIAWEISDYLQAKKDLKRGVNFVKSKKH